MRKFQIALMALLALGFSNQVSAQEFGRQALNVPLPDELLGNSCLHTDLGPIGEGFGITCLGENMLEDASVGVTVAAVSEMDFGDLKDQMRETFHESGIRRIVREKRIKLRHSPEVVVLEGVYNTNLGLRRTWSAYHDGVLVRALVSIFSEEADGDYKEEILSKIFTAERFAKALGEQEEGPSDE